jgi:hypothetical protein
MGEVYVPLLAITSNAEFLSRLERGASLSFGHFSHFEVFPTLLIALGYDVGWVQRSYGASLMDVPSPDRRFMIGSPGFQPLMISVESTSKLNSSAAGRLPGQGPQKEGASDEHKRFLR